MKRYASILLVILLLLTLPVAASASEDIPLIIDMGNILTSEEEYLLESKASDLQQAYSMDVVILTLDSLEGANIASFSDDFYDSLGYSDDGVILVLAMREREWYISTCGDGIYALTDYGIQQLSEVFLPLLSEGWYYDGFFSYLQTLSDYLEAFRNGSPYDGYADYSKDYYHGVQEETVYYSDSGKINVLISIGIGLIAAIIAILIMRSSMSTKRPQTSAHSYIINGSYHLKTHQDLFLYSNISKVRRQETNTHSGGGSSVHRSSGGRHHGGGGGRF